MWWGSTGLLQLRVIITLLLLYWLSNSQLTVCPLDLKRGRGKRPCFLLVCWCVLTPCVAQRSQILKQGLRAWGVAKRSSSSLPFTPGWHSFLSQNNKLPSHNNLSTDKATPALGIFPLKLRKVAFLNFWKRLIKYTYSKCGYLLTYAPPLQHTHTLTHTFS